MFQYWADLICAAELVIAESKLVYIKFTSRKLYEPKLFPEATVLKLFDKYFGKFDDRDPREVRIIYE